METLKSAVGMGGEKESGQDGEPASGEQGAGTIGQPFDAGNNDGTAENKDEAANPEKTEDSKPNGATPQEEKKTESTTKTTASAASPTSDSQKHVRKSSGSNWFKNAFSRRKDEDSAEKKSTPSKASAAAQQTKEEAAEEDKNRLPNHLGVHVPQGASIDLAAPEPPEKTNSSKMAETNQTVVNASADGVDSGFGKPNQLNLKPDSAQQRKTSGPSVQQLRGSRASIAAPTKQRVFNPHSENPGRIPTAGGKQVGSAQFEERRRMSMISADMRSPSVEQEGGAAADAVQRSGNGEGSSKMAEQQQNGETKPSEPAVPVPETHDSVAPDEAAPGDQAVAGAEDKKEEETPAAAATTEESKDEKSKEDKSTVEKAKEKAKENLPTPTTGKDSGKERRGSRFDAFKGRLGIGKKS